jgi:hypothetical protein
MGSDMADNNASKECEAARIYLTGGAAEGSVLLGPGAFYRCLNDAIQHAEHPVFGCR